MKNILIIIAPLVFFLWLMGCMMDSAIADVTGAGSTTNDQVTSGSSSSNTAITGGYHSESSTTYATGASSNTTTNNETNNNSYTGDTRTVNSANAPALSNMSQDVCTIGVGVGGSSFSF